MLPVILISQLSSVEMTNDSDRALVKANVNDSEIDTIFEIIKPYSYLNQSEERS